jgi:hypothetical protein
MKKLLILTLVLCFAIKADSQTDLNTYKYVVIPMQYDFLQGKDVYRLNTLTKHLFKQQGFDAYFNAQELPEDLFENRCLAMYVDVKKVKSFLSTKIQIEVKDCKGQLIMTSQTAKTKEKDYAKAYNIVVREAFKSFESLNYKYEPKPKNDEVVILKKEESLKEESLPVIEVVESDNEHVEKINKDAIVKTKKVEEDVSNTIVTQIYYAQKNENGFQLVDSEPKIVMILLKTAADNVFTVKGKDAIVFKKDDKWIYSEHSDKGEIKKVLNIKF